LRRELAIVPMFMTPAPPGPAPPLEGELPPWPSRIVPAFLRVVIVPEFRTPAPPTPPRKPPPPFPPLTVPLLLRVVIVPELAIPAPPEPRVLSV
jgi:hypothetical protein